MEGYSSLLFLFYKIGDRGSFRPSSSNLELYSYFSSIGEDDNTLALTPKKITMINHNQGV